MEVVALPLTLIDLEFISPSYHSPATIPFAWEEKPGVPKSFYKFLEQDFTFDVSTEFTSHLVPAEDLFNGGVIKLPDIKRSSLSLLSSSSYLPFSKNKRTQSFSTHGGWECPWEEQEHEQEKSRKQQEPAAPMIRKPQLVSSCSDKGSKKWSFKNLFLFRSASDGRAMDRDPLKKYSTIFRKHDENFRNSSLSSTEARTHGSGSGLKRRGVSAHELHYKVNRAVSNNMKKRTFLPYKQGILG